MGRNMHPKRYPVALPAVFLPLLGIFLIISGSNALLFSSTYYTYKTALLSPIDESELYLNYHLSDTYRGEKFISEESGAKYRFELVASREIESKENKLQTILGLAFFLTGIGLHFNRWQLWIKRLLNKDTAET